jgi:hypothetical protein
MRKGRVKRYRLTSQTSMNKAANANEANINPEVMKALVKGKELVAAFL